VGTLALIVAYVLLGTSPLPAQEATADVLGTVTDSTGAVVPNAKVTIHNLNTGITNVASSGKTGEYLFSHLQIGTYKLTIEAAGFKAFTASHLTLAVGDRARLDAKLEVGSQTETVEIEATAAPALKTDSSTQDTLITTTAVADLPLNGRNIINLVQLSSGVTEGASNALSNGSRTDDLRSTSAFSANGQNDIFNNNLVDGMDNNERSIGTQVVKLSIDAIDQVKVMTNLYPAEYSRSEGGVINVITKSGENTFHGSLYEYLRNDMFDARNFFTKEGTDAMPELRQNQFGGSIGGPILKNKTFFFGDYEGFRQVTGSTTYTDTVPQASTLEAVSKASVGSAVTVTDPLFTTTANPTGEYTVTVTQLGKNLMALYPEPTISNASSNNYVYTPSQTQFSRSFDGRFDHHISDKDLLFARYSYGDVATHVPGSMPSVTIDGSHYSSGATADRLTTQGVGVGWTHVFSPSLLLEAKAGFTRYNNAANPDNPTDAATKLGFASCSAGTGYCINSSYGGASIGLPGFTLENYTGLGDGKWTPLTNINNSYQYQVALTWNRNSHSVKAGVSLIRRQLDRVESSSARGAYTLNGDVVNGSPLADLVEGIASYVEQQTVLSFPNYRSWEPGVYIQDDWRVKPWLTLNLGVRYDIFTPYTDAHDTISNFDATKGVLVSPALVGDYHASRTANVSTQFTNISPRIGFAASLPHQMVLRGGFGLSYFPEEIGNMATMTNFPFSWSMNCGTTYATYCPSAMRYNTTSYAVNMAAGITEPYLNASTVTALPSGTEIDAVSNHLKNGRLAQYSLEIQKEFGANVLSIGYIGNQGRHLPVVPDINQAAYATASGTNCSSSNISGCTFTQGATPYTAATTIDGQDLTNDTIYTLESSAMSLYNAMQVSFTRRLSKGLATNFNYTWSHASANGAPQGEGGNLSIECVRNGCIEDLGNGSTKTVNGFSNYDYGNSDLDVHQRFTAMVNYALPFAKSAHGVLGYAAKGWSANATAVWQSGLPFTVTEIGSINASGITGFRGGDRPNLVGSPKAGTNGSISKFFNTDAFETQTPGQLGNVMPNSVYGPHQRHLDLALSKDFSIYEGSKLQFRAEAYNLTNTPNFGAPSNNLGGSTFGEISSTNSNARLLQLALRFSF
jgi:hypothetical protein